MSFSFSSKHPCAGPWVPAFAAVTGWEVVLAFDL